MSALDRVTRALDVAILMPRLMFVVLYGAAVLLALVLVGIAIGLWLRWSNPDAYREFVLSLGEWLRGRVATAIAGSPD